MKDVKSFDNSIIKIKVMLTQFNDEIHESKMNDKTFKKLTSIVQSSVDTVVFTRATTTSETFSVTDFGLIVVPIFVGIAFALSLGK